MRADTLKVLLSCCVFSRFDDVTDMLTEELLGLIPMHGILSERRTIY